MLPQRLRLRKSADFVAVLRRGRKVSRRTLILHALETAEPRFGLVVSRQVGSAVERNRVKRQLRHGAARLLDPARPMAVVVRALPAAIGPGLIEDLDSAWRQALEGVRS
ncbi:MAG: ribonuclease P protein component [Propionibacteriaceae bacterium]|jgi:ribonuclease P protein component|nr:ribonuclease P protein component [Propionibacteriaceae bacterium]